MNFFKTRKQLFAQVAVDAALINFAVLVAWFLRYVLLITPQTGEGFFYQPFSSYIPYALFLTGSVIVIFRREQLYFPARGRKFLDEVYKIANGVTTAILFLMAITFFLQPLVFSRAVYVYTALTMTLFLSLARWVERRARAQLRARGRGMNRVLIVGAGEVGRALMRTIVAQPDLGYHLVGFVDDDPERGATDIGRFKALGATEHLVARVRELGVNEVIVSLPWSAREKIIAIKDLCQREGITTKIVPDLLQLSLSAVAIDEVGGVPLVTAREIKIGAVNSVIKRLMDISLGAIFLALAAPVMFFIALLIRLDSPGPVIFSHTRIGRGGRKFIIHKFRSMSVAAEEELEQVRDLNEATGPLFKIKNDPRHTRLGRVIRRMSLDELPQLLNVLRGEMSLVGPRPPMMQEVEQYQDWHKRRLEVSPGITGLWQVSGRSELTFDEMVMLDIYYIENWSLWLDLQILLKTIPTVLFARGAY
ncbi:MAG: undecaprenyl-phosphate glucose phosphotransferase [Chloroflexi bacterium]|nr:undecaprenyl-phosphate glucose phosphotransferase [Chloroflexota bacterium]